MSMQQLVLDLGGPARATLENFVSDGQDDNVVAHLRLSADSVRSPVPTYLWGPAGSGKTHLLHAVCERLLGQGALVGWLDASVLAPPEFDEAWAVVVFDDCHLYTAAQQAAAFNWFVNAQNPVHGPARWVLASAAVPPTDLQLREDLRTRLGWGHVFQLHALAEAQRRAVLCRAAKERGWVLHPEVVDYILQRFARDLGSLMALLEQLDRYALRTQRAVTIPLIKAMLESD